jgi:hypothetical protein
MYLPRPCSESLVACVVQARAASHACDCLPAWANPTATRAPQCPGNAERELRRPRTGRGPRSRRSQQRWSQQRGSQQLHSHSHSSEIHALHCRALARAHHRPTTGLLLRLQLSDRGHVRRRQVHRRQVRLAGRLAAPGAPLRDCAGVGGVEDAGGRRGRGGRRAGLRLRRASRLPPRHAKFPPSPHLPPPTPPPSRCCTQDRHSHRSTGQLGGCSSCRRPTAAGRLAREAWLPAPALVSSASWHMPAQSDRNIPAVSQMRALGAVVAQRTLSRRSGRMPPIPPLVRFARSPRLHPPGAAAG